MFGTLLQILGLVGLTVAGILAAGVAGGVAGASVAVLYVGLAVDRKGG